MIVMSFLFEFTFFRELLDILCREKERPGNLASSSPCHYFFTLTSVVLVRIFLIEASVTSQKKKEEGERKQRTNEPPERKRGAEAKQSKKKE